MKVYFIGMGYKSCYYVRCLQPLIHNGWSGDQKSLRTSRADNQTMFKEAIKADVIVFHRPIDKKMLEAAKLLKLYGKMVVMDNDDTYAPNSGVPTQMFGKLNDKLKIAVDNLNTVLQDFAMIADLVTVSTEFLAAEYKPYNKNVVVLPNCVDPLDWPKPKRNEGDEVRVGFVGSVASNQDYKVLQKTLDALKEAGNVKIVLFALPHKSEETKWVTELYKPEFDFWSQYNVEWTPFCQVEDYMTKLNDLKLDLMLIPRYDSYFNRAKSNVKFLEASMCEVPVIAQSFNDGLSPYEVNPKDAENMILCNNEDQWLEATMDLVSNKDKRRALGQKAREYVINNYNIANNAHKWADAYKKVWNELKK